MSYWSNQIIWDLDKNELFQIKGEGTFAFFEELPERHTHLVYTAKFQGGKPGSIYVADGGLTGAAYLLERDEIRPANTLAEHEAWAAKRE